MPSRVFRRLLVNCRARRVTVALLASFAVAAVMLAAAAPAPAAAPAGSLAEVIEQVQPKIVKIYGAGGYRGMEAYQSGVLISPEGHILTVFSYVLDTDYITVTLDDGRRFDAKLLGADPRLEVAVLKIEAEGLPCFDLAQSVPVGPGSRVLAFSNLYGVAVGDEPVSVQHGVVSVVTDLAARRGIFETTYRGPVYVLDAMTNNPGAAGGALVTRRGELAGMLGKELRNSLNNTWLNYAVPIDQLLPSVEDIRAGRFIAREEEKADDRPEHAVQLAELGILLVPDVLERTPPYVDQVAPASPAAAAGIQPDDLILLVGDHLIQSCKALAGELEYIDRADPLPLTLLRGQELVEVVVKPN
jgi:S1-C subfamily serine protease